MYAAGGRLGYEKTQSALRALVCFFSATFGAGVVATQRPIALPKRHLPSARYAKWVLNWLENIELTKLYLDFIIGGLIRIHFQDKILGKSRFSVIFLLTEA
jgi:hypothetical protein